MANTRSTPKGTIEKVAGIDSYVTGDKNATNVIVCIYDIFGFWNTTQKKSARRV